MPNILDRLAPQCLNENDRVHRLLTEKVIRHPDITASDIGHLVAAIDHKRPMTGKLNLSPSEAAILKRYTSNLQVADEDAQQAANKLTKLLH